MTIEVVEFFQSFRNGFFDFFFSFISFLGEEYIYILILAIIYYAYNKKLGEFFEPITLRAASKNGMSYKKSFFFHVFNSNHSLPYALEKLFNYQLGFHLCGRSYANNACRNYAIKKRQRCKEIKR